MAKAKETDADTTGAGAPGDVEAAQAAATASEPGTERVSADDYSTNGKTKVATPRGYRFEPSDKSIPVINHEGVLVTAEQAATIVEESGKLALVVSDEKEGDN